MLRMIGCVERCIANATITLPVHRSAVGIVERSIYFISILVINIKHSSLVQSIDELAPIIFYFVLVISKDNQGFQNSREHLRKVLAANSVLCFHIKATWN